MKIDLEKTVAKTYTPKPVPDFGTTYPYTKTIDDKSGTDAKWGTVYSVTGPGLANSKQVIDKVGINTDTNTIAIFEAFNKSDQPALGQKLYLSDIIMSLFKQAGKNPTDLNLVHVDQIINTDSENAFKSIYTSLGKDPETDVVVFSSSVTGAEKDNFNKIANTPFGLAVDRMNQEFSTGKTVQSYALGPATEDEEYSDMEITLG